MSVTIEDVMAIAERFALYTLSHNGALISGRRDELRAALLALVAQARDEEAEAIHQLCVDQPATIGLYLAKDICIRIAGRKR